MNIERTILMELGMAVVGLAGILAYKRFVRKHRQTRKTPMSSNSNVRSDTDPVISRRHSRIKIARGMVREWDMMSGKGMTNREITAMYGVSLVTVDRYLADVNRRQVIKTMKSPVCLTVPTDDAVIKQDLSIKKNHISYE